MARPLARLGAAALAATAGLSLSACTTGGADPVTSGSAPAAAGAKVAIAMAGDPTSLDPHKGNVAADFMMARMLFDPLVRRDDGGKIIAGLASSWKATPTSAEFTLRDDVTCSDGTKLTAKAVADSINRFADPATGAGAAAQVFGAANKATATADDAASKVTVTLTNPWSDLLYGLTLPQASIMCPAALTNPELAKSGGKGAGTGPYVVAEAKPGVAYTLTGRTDYAWVPVFAKPMTGTMPTTVEMKPITSEATMANGLETGTIDYAGLTGADVARFANKPDFTMLPSPIIRMMVVFNEREGRPGADPKVREAVAAALDRTAFNNAVTRGSGVLMASIADAAVPCASKDESLLTAFDPAAAKKALAGVKFKVVGTNAVAAGAGNEYIQAALKSAGAEVELRNLDSPTWSTEVLGNKGDWDVTLLPNLNLTNLLTTPASFFAGGEPPAGRNFGGVENAAFSKAFGLAMSTIEDTAKCQAWDDAQKALLSEHDVVPLAAANVFYITSKRVTALAPDGLFDPSTVRLKG